MQELPLRGPHSCVAPTQPHKLQQQKGNLHSDSSMAPKRRGKKKKHAAPRYVSNADELDNRNKAFGKESLARKARRRAAGCDDDDDDLANGAAKMSLSDYDDDEDQPVSPTCLDVSSVVPTCRTQH